MAKNPRLIDLTGQRFGLWTALEKAGNAPKGAALWRCRCDCGAERPVIGADLRSGASLSCGCASSRATLRERATTHGMTGTRLHICWKNMLRRCRDRSNKVYGGKGVTVCDEWMAFEPFHAWAVVSGYSEGLTIERKDNALGYSPGNCKWATRLEQARNRSIVRMQTKVVSWAEVAAKSGVPVAVMNNRICSGGWSAKKAATTAVGAVRGKALRNPLTGRFQTKAAPAKWKR